MKKHELRKSLPDMVFHEQVLLFAAGILWEQAFDGRLSKLLSRVWSLPDNVVNLEASIWVSTLESDGMVKIINTRKHRQSQQATRG